MKAVVLVAGLGSRLGKLTKKTPKPLLPVANEPLLHRTIQILQRQGIEEIILNPCYLGDQIRRSLVGFNGITFCPETVPLGTAGALKNMEHLLEEPFLVINGDNLMEFQVSQLVEEFEWKCPAMLFGMVSGGDPATAGFLYTKDGWVDRLDEKPGTALVPGYAGVNAGIYIIHPWLLRGLPTNCRLDLCTEVIPYWLQRGVDMVAVKMNGFIQDIGSYSGYLSANRIALTRAPRKLGGRNHISPTARIVPPVLIGEQCIVADGATVGPFVVMDKGCYVAGTVSNSVLWEGTVVYPHEVVDNRIRTPEFEINARTGIVK
jgi:mannose-1-phosphate guanylyltransferase